MTVLTALWTSAIAGPAKSDALPLAARAPLSFEERVAGQRAIEEVFWRHRTAENTSTKPPLSQVLPEAALREKVSDAIRMSNALESLYHENITGEQLQTEMDRMAAASKQPETLRELWAALGNDPHLIAECLARPQLADRLLRRLYSNDPGFNAAPRATAHADRIQYESVEEMRQMSGTYAVVRFTRGAQSETTTQTTLPSIQFDALLQEIAGAFVMREDGPSFDRSPVGTRARPLDEIPVGRVSEVQEGTDRFSVVAVLARDQDHIELATVEWPKVSFDTWWKSVRDTLSTQVEEPQSAYQVRAVSSDGDSWTPTISGGTDEWRPIAGMDFRVLALHVWTGSEMIVWGGWSRTDFAFTNPHTDGGRYDPATDTWRPISVIGAPAHRMLGLMPQPVWTGKEMIIWGGFDPVSGDNYNDGARYNPATDTWTPTSTVGAPVPRDSYSIVWTGTEMIVWGGWNGHDEYTPWFVNSGGRYNPETDTWQPTSTGPGCPAARQHHVAVWTGSKMIVWGGIGWLVPGQPQPGTDDFNSGGVYDPQTDTWTLTGTNLVGAPTDRYYPTAVWTGTEMIIWGGRGGTNPTGSGGYDSAGGRYNPATDTWTPTSTVNVPGQRKWHFAVWTGTEMLIWGGDGPGPNNQNGGRYNPVTDTWVTLNQVGQPPLSYWLNGVWTGTEMLVWGGTGRDDAGYNPSTDTWRPMNTPAISQPYDGPYGHSVVWTGSEMIVWGGTSNSGAQNIGGVYVPSTDTWRLTTTVNAPDPRYAHTAVWTGNQMIVWGGIGGTNTGNTGASYNPATDVWTVTSLTASTPSKRGGHTAVWTGSDMIVWGGYNGTTAYDSGARYHPATDTWLPTSTTGAPTPRYSHSAVWSGSKMIIWGGGTTTTPTSTGAQYDPATDSWQAISAASAPSARSSHTAIWTGNKMIVWGGGSYSGGRYDPLTDAWQPVNTSGYAGGVIGDSAVWTGSEMIVWGGGNNIGGRYDPLTDMWQSMSIPRFLMERSDHSAIWTGSSMIVFGGNPMTTTGAAYILPSPPIPTSVVSRKTHGSAGTFDIDLLPPAPGIECRTGGANGDYTLVFSFVNTVTSCGVANTGAVSSGPNANQCTVNLTGVANAQNLTVTLTGTTDSTGATGVVSGTMGVLIGDTNADGSVNSADIGQTKSQSGNLVNGSNFRQDVTVDGNINSADIGLVKSKSGTALP